MPGAGLNWTTTTTGQSSFFNSSQGGTTAGSNINAAGNSYWNGSVYFADVHRNPFNAGFGVTASSTGSTYNVEVSWDDYTSATWTASGGNWAAISGFAGAASTGAGSMLGGNIAYPVRMIRLNVISGSSTVVVAMYLTQAAGD